MTKLQLQKWMLNQTASKIYETDEKKFVWSVTPGSFLEDMPQQYDVVCRNFPGKATKDCMTIEVRRFDDDPTMYYFKLHDRPNIYLNLADAISAMQKVFLKRIGYEDVKMVI